MKANRTCRRVSSAAAVAAVLLLLWTPAFGQDGEDPLVRLAKAGFDAGTLETIAAEKILETAAFSVEDLIALKRAGYKTSTLQSLLKSRSFVRERQPIVYGAASTPIRLASVGDLVDLKRSGISDAVIEAIVLAAGSRAVEDREEALGVLEGLEIRIDTRSRR